jgi:hypothetical protein
MASMTVEQILARLRRDGHGDLITAVHDRELSAYGAACLVGYVRRKRTKSSPGEDPRSRYRLFRESVVLKGMMK